MSARAQIIPFPGTRAVGDTCAGPTRAIMLAYVRRRAVLDARRDFQREEAALEKALFDDREPEA